MLDFSRYSAQQGDALPSKASVAPNSASRLDFTRPFLPESLAMTGPLGFLSPTESVVLNQIRGFGYLHTASLVEALALPLVMDHLRPTFGRDDVRVRGMLTLVLEEARRGLHIAGLAEAFETGLGTRCRVFGRVGDVAEKAASAHPLALALFILQAEWQARRHALESAYGAPETDPVFGSLLDMIFAGGERGTYAGLVVEALAEQAGEDELDAALRDYGRLVLFLDMGIEHQVRFDMATLATATGRKLTSAEAAQFEMAQRRAMRWTYIGSGLTHPSFVAAVAAVSPEARRRIDQMAPAFC
jgi:hypothetical protein